MEKRNVKNLFITILIFLPLQYGMVGIVGEMQSEPWPSFVFPGFKTVHHFQGNYVLERTHLEIEKSEISDEQHFVTPRQFFYDISVQNINGFMRTVFADQETIDSFSAETISWLRKRAEQFSNKNLSEIKLVRSNEYASRIGPDLQVDSVSVRQVLYINLEAALNE